MNLYRKILAALADEPELLVATVVSTAGSTPAPALSKMLIMRGGTASAGTIGGGCMEGEVLQRAARRIGEGRGSKAEFYTYELTDDEDDLICGGSLTVLVEPVTREDVPLLENLLVRSQAGQDSIVCRMIAQDGGISAKVLVSWRGQEADPPVAHLEALFSIENAGLAEHLAAVQKTQHLKRLTTPSGDLILEPVSGIPRLIVFGGGHISRSLVPAASMAGFRVTVVDDREKYAHPARFPDAEETIAGDFTRVFGRLHAGASDYLVIVTRGHRHDEEVLRQALRCSPSYVGMIGSRHKVITAYKNLLASGVPLESLERVHAPIGIAIGALTAEEIALSIVAELIRVRRNFPGTPGSMSDNLRPIVAELARTLSSQHP